MISLKAHCVLVCWARESQSQIKFENRKCKKSRLLHCTFSLTVACSPSDKTFQTRQLREIHSWKHRNVSFVAVFSVVLLVEINLKKTMEKENVFSQRLQWTFSLSHDGSHDHPRTNHRLEFRPISIGIPNRVAFHRLRSVTVKKQQIFIIRKNRNFSFSSFWKKASRRRILIEFILTTICNGTEIPKGPKKAHTTHQIQHQHYRAEPFALHLAYPARKVIRSPLAECVCEACLFLWMKWMEGKAKSKR